MFAEGGGVSGVAIPRFLETPELAWVKCEEVRSLTDREAVCLVRGVDRARIVIGSSEYFDVGNRLVQAVKVGMGGDGEADWLVDFPSGERLPVSGDLLRDRHGRPVRSGARAPRETG